MKLLQDKEGRAQRLADARHRKRAALEQQRRDRECEELAECSFAPAKAPKPPLMPKVPLLLPAHRHNFCHGVGKTECAERT